MTDAFGIISMFSGKRGLEIGGPSPIFASDLPIYPVCASLDGVNFAASTTWSANGERFRYYEDRTGDFVVAEASDLPDRISGTYDFVLASHCLEHCANAIKAFKEWHGAVKQDGIIVTVVPDRRYTFDHKRAITTFEHLLTDFAKDIGEDDLSHFDEILLNHDIAMDPGSGTPEYFRARSLQNIENRCFHHHVFDLPLIEKIYSLCGTQVLFSAFLPPHHLITVGRRV